MGSPPAQIIFAPDWITAGQTIAVTAASPLPAGSQLRLGGLPLRTTTDGAVARATVPTSALSCGTVQATLALPGGLRSPPKALGLYPQIDVYFLPPAARRAEEGRVLTVKLTGELQPGDAVFVQLGRRSSPKVYRIPANFRTEPEHAAVFSLEGVEPTGSEPYWLRVEVNGMLTPVGEGERGEIQEPLLRVP